MPVSDRTRIAHIDTLRGFACVTLVAYHVIGNAPEKGLRLPDDHILMVLNDISGGWRMPLFAFVAGFVLQPVVRDLQDLRGGIESRARRLLVPFFFVATLHYAVQTAVYGGNQFPIWAIYLYHYEHFWFLQAIFLLMVLALVMSYLAGEKLRWVVFVFGAVAVASYLMDVRFPHDIFASSHAIYLAPFFMLGLIVQIHRLDLHLAGMRKLRFALVGLCIAILVAAFMVQLMVQEPWMRAALARHTLLGLVLGFAGCIGLFCLRWENRLLAWIGLQSYTIYLFHVFFTAGTRIVLTRLFGPISEYVLFPLGLLAGVVGPMLLHQLIMVLPWSRFAFLGMRLPRNSDIGGGAQGLAPSR